jgi:glycosyltransferase involved in cell wall biosynthesis
MHNRGGIAAITWAPCQRHAEDHARRLNASFYKIHYLLHRRPILAPIKYVPQCLKTWWVLLRQRPTAVYVFISPVFAALAVAVYCRLARIPFIVDVGGQALISRRWAWSIPLLRILSRQACVNIVDQQRFRLLFESWGAETLLLERPPLAEEWKTRSAVTKRDRFTVTSISTFSEDEPIELVLGAARRLPEIDFFVLGDTGLARKGLLESAPRNVTFPGYLVSDDYWSLLSSSQAVMVLSTDHYSLCSGAVEGMALGKPLVLSKQPALTDYFRMGAVFVDNTVEGIVGGVRTAQDKERVLTQQITELAIEKRDRWESEYSKIWCLLGV